MKELKDFYNQNKKMARKILWLIAAAILIVPLVINIAFQCKAICKWFDAEWEASDALIYYGNVLSFLGTVVLSGLALWQNHKIQEANTAHTKLLEDMEREKNRPLLRVRAISSTYKGGNIEFLVENYSDNVALNVNMSDFKLIDSGGKSIWKDDASFNDDYISLEKKYGPQKLKNPPLNTENKVSFKLAHSDVFGTIYTYHVVGSYKDNEALPKFIMKKVDNVVE